MPGRQTKNAPSHFKTMVQSDVPQGRNGKHKRIVTAILKDLDNLRADSALKVPLAELKFHWQNLWSQKKEFAPR